MRIGQGYDVHAFERGRRLVIGGVQIDHKFGLAGHSDADVLLHAVCDACLGAAGLGDIGRHFPDSSREFKDIDSRLLLRRVAQILLEKGWRLGNLDSIIIAEQPRMSPHIADMAENIAVDLGVAADRINVKATTTEKLGFEGRGEGIAAQAVVLLEPVDAPETAAFGVDADVFTE